MVSSAVDMDLDVLVDALVCMRADHGDDPEYQEWRAQFPADWPM
jgi:hypothetical protein